MPTISVPKRLLQAQLERPQLTDAEFRDLCFLFGVELDAVATAAELGRASGSPDDVIYRIDVPANRYDVLCTEGMVLSLRCFLGLDAPPRFAVAPVAPLLMRVTASTAAVRPFVVGCVLRGVEFDQDRYDSFIDLQDKLHQNICRQRTLCAIGTHDLDTLTPPFLYDARAPEDISFVPLKQTRAVNGRELMELYKDDAHLGPYLPIIRDSPLYPVITDARGVVLSLPPIINGEHSKISLHTRNIFVECTATDITKVNIVLNTIVAMFSRYCTKPFTCEPVVVEAADGSRHAYPRLDNVEVCASVDYVNSCIGLALRGDDMVQLLRKMQLDAVLRDGTTLAVSVPPTRSDVLHACDIMEDVAIAYGYINLPRVLPDLPTVARHNPRNALTDQVRVELAAAGYTELLSFVLGTKADHFENMRETEPAGTVTIDNREHEMPRNSLVPGILKTLAANRSHALPLQVFEVADVVLPDASSDVGARNERRICAAYTGSSAGFELVHGTLDRVMRLLETEYAGDAAASMFTRRVLAKAKSYKVVACEDRGHADDASACAEAPMFMRGCVGNIMVEGSVVGRLGILHPFVLDKFGLKTPVSLFEMCLDPFL